MIRFISTTEYDGLKADAERLRRLISQRAHVHFGARGAHVEVIKLDGGSSGCFNRDPRVAIDNAIRERRNG